MTQGFYIFEGGTKGIVSKICPEKKIPREKKIPLFERRNKKSVLNTN